MAILFDLDGTLVDSAHDFITAARIYASEKRKTPKITINYENLSPWVSYGSRKFLEAAFDDVSKKDIEDFVEYYRNTNFEECILYPGMDEIIRLIKTHNRPWGIVTNKAEHLTTPLVANLSINSKPNVVISGDTLEKAKPHPDPILHACEQLNVNPQECLYIGDAKRDILSGNSAGMPTIAALYGYIHDVENARATWPTTNFANTTDELKTMISNFLKSGNV